MAHLVGVASSRLGDLRPVQLDRGDLHLPTKPVEILGETVKRHRRYLPVQEITYFRLWNPQDAFQVTGLEPLLFNVLSDLGVKNGFGLKKS